MSAVESAPPLLRYMSQSIRWTPDEYQLFYSKCDHYTATFRPGSGEAGQLTSELGAQLRQKANVNDKMSEKQIAHMTGVIRKWFLNNWTKHADMTKFVPHPAVPKGSKKSKGKATDKSTAAVSLEAKTTELARTLWAEVDSSWTGMMDKYVVHGLDKAQAKLLAILTRFTKLTKEDIDSWINAARVKIEQDNRPPTKAEIAEQKTKEIPAMLSRCLAPYEQTSGNYFLVHYFNGTAQRLNLWVSPMFEPMLQRQESRQIDVSISNLIATEYANQLTPAWSSNNPPQPAVYRNPNSPRSFFPRLPAGVDDAMERRRHLSTFYKIILVGQGCSESRVPYTRIQAEHSQSNYRTVAAHYLVRDVPFCSPHELKVEHLNLVWEEYHARQTRDQLPFMFSMILCNPATRKVPSCQMFLTHDVEEDQSTIFYPTAITDLPYGNRVKYSEESTTYAQWLLQVVPETDAECAGRSNASVLSESGSPLLVSAAFHQLLTTLKDIKSASSDADVLVHDAAPALDSDIEEDAPSAQKPGREQETIQEAASDIQQFSDSEQEEADTTITLNDTNIQTADELLLVQPSVTVNQKSVSEQSDMFKSPGAPEYESSTLNVEFLEGLDSADLAKAYETAMNALEDIPQNESLEQVTESVLDGQIESLESNPDHNNSAPVPSVASLEDQFLNLDGHPLPLKCPDGWSETMNALNDDMQRVPDNLAEVWAPVVAQWHVFETPQEKGHLRPKSARYNPPALADAQHIGHTKENWVAKVCTTDQSHEIKMFYVALQLMHRKIAMGKNLNYYALTKPSGTEDDWNLIAFGGEFGMVVILKLILYWGLDFHDTMQSMSDWMKVVTDLVSVLKCMTEYIGWKFKSITKTPAAPLPPLYVTQPVPSGSGTGARVAKHKLTQSSPSKPKLSGDLGAVAASTSQQPQKAPSKHRKSTMVAKAADVDQPSAADVSIASTSASAESGLRRSSRAPKPQQRSS